MSQEEAPLPETINNRYRVLKLLGRGGMGQVFLVEDTRRDSQQMALKTLLPKSTPHIVAAGFRDEFAELSKLEHPNLARAYDFGRIRNSSEFFFTTEFVRGIDLISGVKEASFAELTDITIQILRALDFIHNHGLLHNDLKPGNILLETQAPAAGSRRVSRSDLQALQTLVCGRLGRVKLIDFGLISREHRAWTSILGTLRYISPERIRRQTADRRSDLYSLGVVLYVLFGQRPPFASSDHRSLLKMHLTEPAPPIRKYNPGLPQFMVDLIHRLLEKRPEDRFANAAEALQLIEASRGGAEVDVALARSWHGGRLTPGALLHRQKEREELRELFDRAIEGDGDSHAVILEGPSGIGKTRLVEDLRSHVQVSHGTFVEISGSAVEGDLQPFANALIAGWQASGAVEADAVRAALQESRCGDEDFSHLLENLVRDHVRRHPLLIHFDDFDRASRAARRLAMELVHVAGDQSSDRDGPCRLLIVISRQSKNGAGHLALSEVPVLELRPFTDEESREFLEHVFGQQAVPPAVAETFQSLARGNPLFLVELANHLVEQGRVVFTGAQWKFPESLQGLSLPSSLSGLFSRKIESLQGSLLDILNWVAVSGRPLARGVIVRSADLSPERVDSLLKELTDRSLLTRFEMKDGVERYELSYGGSREILCGRIEEGERRRLHQRLAQNTEEEFPGRDDLADELADHWLKAGNEPGFLRFAPKAADLLQARGDFETAVSYRRRIAESMPPTAIAKKIQSLAKLSEMHEFLWDLDACQRDLEAIRDLGQSLLKPADRALLLRRMAGVELARFEFGKAAALLEEAARLASGSAPVCRLAIDAPRAQSIWFTSGPEKASPLLESTERSLFALPPPEAERDKMLWISSASQLAGLRHQTGDLPRARDLYGKALEMLRKMQQPQAAAATECGLGSVLLDAGEYEEALMHLQAALATARRIGDRRTICRARERLGEYCMRFARLGEAFQITQISLEEAEMMHNRAAAASSLRTLGRLYGHAGDDASAFVALRRAARSSHEQGDILGFGLGSVQLARHFLGQGEAIRARHQIEETARELQRFRLPLLEAHCALCLYAGAWKELRRKRDDLAAEARAVFDRHGYRSDLVDAILIQCEVEIEAGEIDRATTLLEELRSLTRDHARPHVACEAMFLLGRLRAEMKDARGASAFFIKARNLARDQHKHRLALRAQEEAKAILLAV